MRRQRPIWLWVSFVYVGFAVLVVVAINTAPDSGFTMALFVIVWLSGIALFIIMVRWWIRFSSQSAASPDALLEASLPVLLDAPPLRETPPHVPEVATKMTVETIAPGRLAEAIAVVAPAQTNDSVTSELTPIVFISHASEDRKTAEVLADELQSRGVRTWLAYRDVEVGGNYAEEIVKAVVDSNYLLVIPPEAAIESPLIRREVTIVIDRGVPLLPVNMSAAEDCMWTLPVDWTYWLSLAQVMRHTDEASTASDLARRITRK